MDGWTLCWAMYQVGSTDSVGHATWLWKNSRRLYTAGNRFHQIWARLKKVIHRLQGEGFTCYMGSIISTNHNEPLTHQKIPLSTMNLTKNLEKCPHANPTKYWDGKIIIPSEEIDNFAG